MDYASLVWLLVATHYHLTENGCRRDVVHIYLFFELVKTATTVIYADVFFALIDLNRDVDKSLAV